MKILTALTSGLIASLFTLTVCAPAASAAPELDTNSAPTISQAVAIGASGPFTAKIVVNDSTGPTVFNVNDRTQKVSEILMDNDLDMDDYRSSTDTALEDKVLTNDENLVLYKSETNGSSEVIVLKAPVETREDANLPVGEEKVESEGSEGKALKTTISTRSLATDAKVNTSVQAPTGAKNKTEEKLTVLEAPKPRIVIVGTKEAAPEPAPVAVPVAVESNTATAPAVTAINSLSAPAQTAQDPAPVSSAPVSASGISGTAMSLVGMPYVFGATGPSAFDCSGLVQYVFSLNGKSVPRVAEAQGMAAAPISPANMQPGDIVWTSFHIGIYVGGGKMVHASSPTTGVIMDDVAPYLAQGYRVGRL